MNAYFAQFNALLQKNLAVLLRKPIFVTISVIVPSLGPVFVALLCNLMLGTKLSQVGISESFFSSPTVVKFPESGVVYYAHQNESLAREIMSEFKENNPSAKVYGFDTAEEMAENLLNDYFFNEQVLNANAASLAGLFSM